ncbi:MAG: 5'-methylthioadenosine/S-adenosylhomocysteine nucleosidase [Thermomicrobiales bacterium]|nr:5'-methylthioadenosine/S-adenosylhomocysteine nucleosidase [Thermomicrobiales bacterium]MCO5220277.1 5'-methylthioadenosine/S-adenosylhomocysteine nucleosidase [Thermomicrobiales bacterium]
MKIGIVVAMSSERVHLDPYASVQTTERHGPWRVDCLTIAGKHVAAVTSGIGMANAAAGTEFLIQTERPDLIMNFGCAGAHRRDLLPGDVVIASEVINHSLMQIFPDGTERYTGYATESNGEHQHGFELESDPKLVELAQTAATANPPQPWPPSLFWPASIPYRLPEVHVGPVVSADTWTQAHFRLDILHERHGSLCEEMEAAAIGRIAGLHGIPFLAIKDISNNEYLRESDLASFSDFPIAEVGKRAATLLAQTIALV